MRDVGRAGRGRAAGRGRGATAAPRKSRSLAVDEHAGVDRLAALDAGDDAQHGVLERVTRARARSSQPARPVAARGAPRRGPGGDGRAQGRQPRRRVLGQAGGEVGHVGRADVVGLREAGLVGQPFVGDERPPRPRPRRRRPAAPRPASRSGAQPSRACSRASYGRPAAAAAAGQLWWNVRAAPWSIRYGAPCQNSMFGLRQERSTLPTSASNHSTRPGEARVDVERGRRRGRARRAGSRRRGCGPGWRAAGPGPLRPARWRPAIGSTSTVTSAGTGRPSVRASSPTITSATSALRPWPAPWNFTT